MSGGESLWTPEELAAFERGRAGDGWPGFGTVATAGGMEVAPTGGVSRREKAERVNFWRSRRYRGIECFWGVPGGGKTYELARWALRQQAAGRPVWCSYGFSIPGAKQFRSVEEFEAIPDGAAVCVDEAPLWFDSRSWQNMDPIVLVRLTQIRHHDIHLRYTAIAPGMVELRLRQITFRWWEHRPLVGPWNLRRQTKSPEGAPQLRQTDGMWRYRRMRSEVALAYDTKGDADTSEWLLEREQRKRGRRR